MRLKSIELSGFKSFARKTTLEFETDVAAIVGPNGSGKSNVAEAFRFALGEQSMKSMRGRRGEDLVWNGSAAVPRAGRASVKLLLDNADRALSLDFDEVAVERVVHRDGQNEYRLNGSVVRLRDITELLAQANVGASGHHIISQGEADRILSASPKDRREMIEDALGLTAYLYKREEAERKLQKAQENIREVEALRRELMPHLKFLAKQVARIEEGEALRHELIDQYGDYFKRESTYLKLLEAEISAAREVPQKEMHELEANIVLLRGKLERQGEKDGHTSELVELERRAREAREHRGDIMRKLGRLEGEIEAHRRLREAQQGAAVPAEKVTSFAHEIIEALEGSLEDVNALKEAAQRLVARAREFVADLSGAAQEEHSQEELATQKESLEQELARAREAEEEVAQAIGNLRTKMEQQLQAERQEERDLFAALARRSELEATLASYAGKEQELARGQDLFKRDLSDTAMLLGRDILEYETRVLEADLDEPRSVQEDRRRKLERLRIKFEELGASNAEEVLKEYKETSERDAFLARELEDLALSSASLRQLIHELTQTLETRFASGIEEIGAQFEQFFKTMFGGGSASLSLVKERAARRGAGIPEEDEEESGEDEEAEEGIEISISLPHKRVKGLHMLSGGERALTSIALIFAMSQVNPPPFLILDETDAALDEANSRRYGDMIETLARRSQLIVITHNRETMSRAGILYGITMGGDGVSKLLSVKFEEAIAVAK